MKIIKNIKSIPIVSSIESIIQNKKIIHYKVCIDLPNVELYESLEQLWDFGTITLNGGSIIAKYVVRPDEAAEFYKKLANFETLYRKSTARMLSAVK